MTTNRIINFGCRLNAYEAEVMRAHADAAGLENAIIVNTCAVTGEAVRQARQAIRKARRDSPDGRIIVTGCAAQTETQRFADMPEVDRIIGNDAKLRPETYRGLGAGRLSTDDSERVRIDDIMSVRETASHMIAGFGTRARAYVQVQNGCDHRCTFCIIPFGRGNSRSVPAGEVVSQIRGLTEQGYGEVVLTGVDITAYGADLPGQMTLGRLVQSILREVPTLPRLRLSSIDSIETDEALLVAIAEQERLMPHLHLSIQAGSDLTLKRMKRRHLRADTIRFCEDVRRLRPDVVFGADLIAGFPTETEGMFDDTRSIVEACDLTYLHVFPYSARPGTPAARMPQVRGDIIRERARRLRELGSRRLAAWQQRQIGQRSEILCESEDRGRTPQFAEVVFDTPVIPGRIVGAKIVGATNGGLRATVTDDGSGAAQ